MLPVVPKGVLESGQLQSVVHPSWKSGRSSSWEGLLCILRRGALSEMDTWLTERFKICISALSASCSSALASRWTPRAFGYHLGEWCMLGSGAERRVSVGQKGGRRRRSCAAAQGPCCLPTVSPRCFQVFLSLLWRLRSLHKTSMAAEQCQAGERSWLNLNLGSSQVTAGTRRRATQRSR